MNHRVAAAESRSAELFDRPLEMALADGVERTRVFAIGDPQTTHRRLLEVLEANDLLGDDGMLAPDVGLISIGDHFDFGLTSAQAEMSPDAVGAEGVRNVRWLAAHPADQVILIAGNHDLSRVQELAFETTESFAAARGLAEQIVAASARGQDTSEEERRFQEQFPRIPTPGVAQRDYSAFSVEQRELVQQLLLRDRMLLAWAAPIRAGAPALLTHAGVTRREVDLLGAPAEARAIARALNRLLKERVGQVAGAWRQGRHAALDLSPLHEPGAAGREGGGLLYHRPACLAEVDAGWAMAAPAPRRFDPRQLPLGLIQCAGHSGHSKCKRELAPWLMPSAHGEPGPIRTLSVSAEGVRYEGARVPPRGGEATLYLLDGAMNATPAARYELFSLGDFALD